MYNMKFSVVLVLSSIQLHDHHHFEQLILIIWVNIEILPGLKQIVFFSHILLFVERLTLAEYHEQEEIFKLRLGHIKKVCQMLHLAKSLIIRVAD